MKEKWTKIRKVFFSTLYLSAFTFGGGYVIVTLMKKKFVDELHWIDEEEMLDLVAIAQSAPGAIAVNGAIVVGYKLDGHRRGIRSDHWNDYSAVCDFIGDLLFLCGILFQLYCKNGAGRHAGRRRRGHCVGCL